MNVFLFMCALRYQLTASNLVKKEELNFSANCCARMFGDCFACLAS